MQPILCIDLNTEKIDKFHIPKDWEFDYIGGASLGARILYPYLTRELDPLSPEAPLLFICGPLTGTYGPAVSRFMVCAKSPATGIWGESNCGGFWGAELRQAGYDGILISGKAKRPTAIHINDSTISFSDAVHLWGLDTYTAQAMLKSEAKRPNSRIVVIGPAGEKLIPFALILSDHGRVAGRTGMGAVMGAKLLKGIVVSGNGEIPIANPDGFAKLRSETNRTLRDDNQTKVIREMGTASGAEFFDYLGDMPKKYYQAGELPGATNISGATIAESILSGVSSCHACVIACGRVVRLNGSDKRKGPEYETLVGFGPNLGITDASVITRFGEMCDRYGMDSISLSNTIGLAFKLYENKTITAQDTGGLHLAWGDDKVVEELIQMTMEKEGFGRYIALGSRELGKKFASEDEAVQVNGLEVAYHDPRGLSGMALVYATSPRGACHNQSDYFMADIGQVEISLGMKYMDRHADGEKAKNVALHQDWRTVINALGMCILANLSPQSILALYNSATSAALSLEEFMSCGERGWILKRVINNRLGLTCANDRLPKPLLQPYRINPGGSNGYVPDFDSMISAYYQARNWDPTTGYPRQEKIQALGLTWTRNDDT